MHSLISFDVENMNTKERDDKPGGAGGGEERNLLKPPVKCMVQNETRGFSFRKNSKKMARVQKSGVVFLYNLVCFLSDDENCCQQTPPYTNSSLYRSATYCQIHTYDMNTYSTTFVDAANNRKGG